MLIKLILLQILKVYNIINWINIAVKMFINWCQIVYNSMEDRLGSKSKRSYGNILKPYFSSHLTCPVHGTSHRIL